MGTPRGVTRVSKSNVNKSNLGAHLGVGPLALDGWEDTLTRLLHLGASDSIPVMLDESGYLWRPSPAANQMLRHSILAVIANGAVTAGAIANQLRRQVQTLDPALKRLVATGFVVRHEGPLRTRRPMYALGDPFLQFHYAVLEPHDTLLRERDPHAAWERRLATIFDSRVRGTVFEEQARTWVRRIAASETVGGEPDHVGPSAAIIEGIEYQLDVVAAVDDGVSEPAARTVLAVGEVRAGETVGLGHLRHLERAGPAVAPWPRSP